LVSGLVGASELGRAGPHEPIIHIEAFFCINRLLGGTLRCLFVNSGFFFSIYEPEQMIMEGAWYSQHPTWQEIQLVFAW
jgi:hypothetical protein